METMLKRDEVTTTSQLAGILPGDPPRVNLVDCAVGRNGVKRHFTQQVPILDEDLFARLQREVSAGDHIRVTLINEYYDTKIVTYVANFQRAEDTRLDIIVQNGKGNLVQNNITEVIMTPNKTTQTKVRK